MIALHYLFLEGIERNNLKWWGGYALAVALSLYASPVSGIIILGHMIFVLLTRKDLIKMSFISVTAGFILYLPWALNLFFNFNRIASSLSWHSNTGMPSPYLVSLFGQIFCMVTVFSSMMDIFYTLDQTSPSQPPGSLSAFISFLFVIIKS